MLQNIKDFFWWFHSTFHGSLVLLWSRIQLLMASVWLGLSTTDLSPVIKDPKYFAYWMIFNAIVTDYLRQRNAEWKPTKVPE